ncbi:MAG TPA: hypothetical protein VHO50_04290 [Bacteroidales bacterium]|nr:hypothetical protein [Bacteroidales bacterium]
MKKVLMSIMLLAGVYGLSFAQQGSNQKSSGSQQGSEQQSQGMGSQQQSTSQGQASSSRDAQWEKIGEKTLDLSTDKGVFDWNADREKTVSANDKYSAIKFRVKDAPVSLTNVEVEYDSGKKQELTVGNSIQPDSDSKTITLNSTEQLDKITFNFNKNDDLAKDKAQIEVWGLKAGAGMGQGNDSDTDRQNR